MADFHRFDPQIQTVDIAFRPEELVLGQKSVRFGKSGFAKAATTSNQEQFTRFSRLQWHVL